MRSISKWLRERPRLHGKLSSIKRRSFARLRRLRLGPREEAFATIYRDRQWGRHTADHDFFSGPGSLPENFGPYVQLVNDYIARHPISRVLDLGCGDYRVSHALELRGAQYLGVDIVSSLIAHNTRHFGSQQVRFARLDIVVDPLPPADLCLVRQVLQHLSNADIQALLLRLDAYEHVLVLDGSITKEATPGENVDVPTGGFRRGGLYLEAAPLHANIEVLLTYDSAEGSERFRLVRLSRAAR